VYEKVNGKWQRQIGFRHIPICNGCKLKGKCPIRDDFRTLSTLDGVKVIMKSCADFKEKGRK